MLRLALLAAAPLVAQAAPIQLQHQARLVDASGAPLNGARTVTVSLHAAAEGGVVLWSRDFNAELADGYFSAVLDVEADGDPVRSEWFAAPVWVGHALGGAALGPRQPVGQVPVAGLSLGVVVPLDSGSTCAVEGLLARDAQGLKLCMGGGWTYVATTSRLVTYNGARRWSDGAHAPSCHAYRNPGQNREYAGETGDGLYWIEPIPGDVFVARCEMDLEGGGWTLVGKFNTNVTGPSIGGVNWRVDSDVNLAYLTAADDDAVFNAGHYSRARTVAIANGGERRMMTYVKQHSTQQYKYCWNNYASGLDANWSYQTAPSNTSGLGACGRHGWGYGATCGVTSTSCSSHDANYTMDSHWMHANGLNAGTLPGTVQTYCGDNSTSGIGHSTAATGTRRGTCTLWAK